MIRILADHVVNRIAAGEVVERPASVVKELVENSLDAGATAIDVVLRDGGRSLIRIVDDGSGMDRQDALLSIERHATSKITSDEDLTTIRTLGFRGEALPSIASVSRFELLTRVRDQDAGTRLKIEGGKLVSVDTAGAAPGTTIDVRSLFFNVPARRKFLRTEGTELAHGIEAVTRAALARPDVAFTVRADDRDVLRVAPSKDRADRARELLAEHGRALVPVAFEDLGFRVEGLVSPVGVHKGVPQGASWLFVNGRFVRDPMVRRGVNEAYAGIVPKGRHPVVVLEVTVDPERVDVNVHPSKTEVRFREPLDLVRVIATGLRRQLEQHGIRRPVERAGPVEELAPERSQASLPMRHAFQPPSRSAGPVLPLIAKTADGGKAEIDVVLGYRTTSPEPLEPPDVAADVAVADGPLLAHPDDDPRFRNQPPEPWFLADAEVEPEGLPTAPPDPIPPGTRADTQADARELLPVPRFQDLRVIGQLAATYVLCEGGGELVVIDQHAAHERVTLHRLRRDHQARSAATQRLLTPVRVELAPARAAVLRDRLDVLRDLGLDVEPFGPHAVAVTAVPALLGHTDVPGLVRDVADELAAGKRGGAGDAIVDHVLATMACHTSVRANQPLSMAEMRALLVALDEVDVAVCAHGRPVAIRVGRHEIEHRFHRT